MAVPRRLPLLAGAAVVLEGGCQAESADRAAGAPQLLLLLALTGCSWVRLVLTGAVVAPPGTSPGD